MLKNELPFCQNAIPFMHDNNEHAYKGTCGNRTRVVCMISRSFNHLSQDSWNWILSEVPARLQFWFFCTNFLWFLMRNSRKLSKRLTRKSGKIVQPVLKRIYIFFIFFDITFENQRHAHSVSLVFQLKIKEKWEKVQLLSCIWY